MRNEFATLNRLGYTTDNGLCHNIKEAKNNVERLYIDEAQKLGVDAVYFRRFYKEDSTKPHHSEPAVCIFQKTESFFNSKEHKELHAALWSAGRIEVYVIQTDARIDIINARKPAKRINVGELEINRNDKDLVLANNALAEFNNTRFSAHLFSSGTFWEQSELIDKIDGNSSPYNFLLDYLMRVRRKLSTNLNLENSTIDKLLIICILVKFLEDIKDDKGKHTLRKIFKTYKIKSFAEALEQNIFIEILGDLATEFNGKIFDQLSDKEKNKIEKSDLSLIAQFLRADIDIETKQLFLWSQYNFNHLPAEVISAIYENFIQADASRKGKQEKGVVYTPLHLVNLLVDEVMPLENPDLFNNNKFKVLDPACGSGVFLVAAYKRMLQWWTINNSKNGIIKYPNKRVAQKILEDNIFGVDIQETAALVSIFGLTTALLDKLTPKEIWDNLKFKNLKEKNIQKNSFFLWANENKIEEGKFDLVIGNPPFNSSNEISKEELKEEEEQAPFYSQFEDIPRGKFALKFFEGALFFGKKICMIIPSSIFLYNKNKTEKPQKYRNRVFTENTVEKIYDFTHLRRDLFHKVGEIPVVALILNKKPSNQKSIEHIIVKRELLYEKKVRFEIDYYDKHYVPFHWAIDKSKQFIWKTNLLGGGRLFHFTYRLSLLKKLGAFLKKKEQEEWVYSIGYITTENNNEKNKANYITGKKTIKPKSFSERGEFELITETSKYFLRKRKKGLYEPPHIIFRLVVETSTIPMVFVNDYLCFNSSFVGISSPPKDKDELKKIYNRLYENKETTELYQVFILATSSKALVYHETSMIKEDIDNLPYPENIEYLIPSLEENIIIQDVSQYYRHLGKHISKNSAGGILIDSITEPELKDFGKTYCKTLNAIYAKNKKSWQVGKVIQTPMFVYYQLGFGKNKGLKYKYETSQEEVSLSLMEDKQSNSGAVFKRIVRQYNHENGFDCVFLRKPHNRRYWLKSIALRDADDTFMDLKEAGF